MKRTTVCAICLFIAALFGFFIFQGKARSMSPDPLRFHGVVSYQNGNWAPQGTQVKCYLGTTLKATVYVGAKGQYDIFGPNSNYPTGTYTLKADDLISMLGENSCNHTEGTTTAPCNVVLNTSY